jgi:hypothetical protein
LADDNHLWAEYGKATSFEEQARLVKQMKWFSEWRVVAKTTTRSACQEGVHVVMADIAGGPVSQIKAQEMPFIRKEVLDGMKAMRKRASFTKPELAPLSKGHALDLAIEIQNFATYQDLEKFVVDNLTKGNAMSLDQASPPAAKSQFKKRNRRSSLTVDQMIVAMDKPLVSPFEGDTTPGGISLVSEGGVASPMLHQRRQSLLRQGMRRAQSTHLMRHMSTKNMNPGGLTFTTSFQTLVESALDGVPAEECMPWMKEDEQNLKTWNEHSTRYQWQDRWYVYLPEPIDTSTLDELPQNLQRVRDLLAENSHEVRN